MKRVGAQNWRRLKDGFRNLTWARIVGFHQTTAQAGGCIRAPYFGIVNSELLLQPILLTFEIWWVSSAIIRPSSSIFFFFAMLPIIVVKNFLDLGSITVHLAT